MLTIRKHQMRAFKDAALRQFEERSARELPNEFPEECAEYRGVEMLYLVQRGIACARAHGIETEAGVTVWLHLTLLFGEGFHADPEWPWAAAALADSRTTTEAERVRRLFDAAARQIDSAAKAGG
jgi:hypothetical protein